MFVYTVRSHAGLGDLSRELDDLSKASFARYDGTIQGTREFKRWFMSRPGMTAESRFVALCHGRPVSSAFVTVTPMRLGGEVVRVGIVDSVMTHPEHRRRGLARRIMTHAIGFMETAGLDASLLYTVARSMPYDFYQRLGYAEYVRVRYYRFASPRPPAGPADLRACTGEDEDALMEFLNHVFAQYAGYVPLDRALWNWRRKARPGMVPVKAYALGAPGAIVATGAVGQAPLRVRGEVRTMVMLNDLAATRAVDPGDVLSALVHRAPPHAPVVLLSAASNEEENRLYEEAGFAVMTEEAAMLKPLTEKGARCIERPPERWYTVTESVVGI